MINKRVSIIILLISISISFITLLGNINPRIKGSGKFQKRDNVLIFNKGLNNTRIKRDDKEEIIEKFNNVIEKIRERNKDIPKKESKTVVTIHAYLKASVLQLKGTDIEKNFYADLLNEWAIANLQEYPDNIKFKISIEMDTNKLKDELAKFLYTKSTDYDIVMLDIVWLNQFKDYLLNLQSYMSSDTLKLFNTIDLDICKYNSKLIALPVYNDHGIMLYRKDLLEKYGKDVPTTWDELEEVSTEILKKEHDEGNTKLEGFIGQFHDGEGATCNIMEWIHSFRDSVDSPCGYFSNDDAINSLNEIKSLMDKNIMSTENLNYDASSALNLFLNGRSIFSRNWYSSGALIESDLYEFGLDILPGKISGVSGSTLSGWNVAVSKFSSNSEIAVKAIQYLASEEVQKIRTELFNLLPSMDYLLNDKDICKSVNCPLIKRVQSVLRPADHHNYLEFSKIITKSFRKALMGEISTTNAITSIFNYAESDITNILSLFIKIEFYVSLGVVGILFALILIYGVYLIFIDK